MTTKSFTLISTFRPECPYCFKPQSYTTNQINKTPMNFTCRECYKEFTFTTEVRFLTRRKTND